jgi:hypothetical protein
LNTREVAGAEPSTRTFDFPNLGDTSTKGAPVRGIVARIWRQYRRFVDGAGEGIRTLDPNLGKMP